MIGHEDPFVQGHGREMDRDTLPVVARHAPPVVELHLTIHHLAQQAVPTAHANGDEIDARGGIVVAWQPD